MALRSLTRPVTVPTDRLPTAVYSCGSGLLSGGIGGTIDGRSFCARFEPSSATARDDAAGLCSSSGFAGDDAADLLGVEHFADEELLGDLVERDRGSLSSDLARLS